MAEEKKGVLINPLNGLNNIKLKYHEADSHYVVCSPNIL